MSRDLQSLNFVFGSPWAILEEKLRVIAAVVEAHMAGIDRVTARGARDEAVAREAARSSVRAPGAIGVVRVHGTILPRGSSLTDVSGIATTEGVKSQFRELLANDEVHSIVLDIDSPGGSVYGVQELAEVIQSARGTKPIVAQAWNMAASAAYWIASSADEIVVTPSGEVGSVGVIAMHSDYSAMFEKEGIRNTIIKAGRYKADMNPYEPLNDEARSFEQSRVDEYYRAFVDGVASGRGVSPKKVLSDFGEGRMFGAKKAVQLGMADRVGTFEDTVRRLSTPQGRSKVRSSELDMDLRRRGARSAATFSTRPMHRGSVAAQ